MPVLFLRMCSGLGKGVTWEKKSIIKIIEVNHDAVQIKSCSVW